MLIIFHIHNNYVESTKTSNPDNRERGENTYYSTVTLQKYCLFNWGKSYTNTRNVLVSVQKNVPGMKKKEECGRINFKRKSKKNVSGVNVVGLCFLNCHQGYHWASVSVI